MIDFYITEQSIRFASPTIAANSLEFLEAEFHFSGDTWDDYSKWAHFRQGDTVYDLNLVDDAISADMGLSLSIGEWEVYVTGTAGESRITTVPVILTVMESGLIDEPLHKIPQSVAEQLDNKATLALKKAMEIEQAAADGEFNGKNFTILGYYDSVDELTETAASPAAGDMYCVGTQEPYNVYVYDGVHEKWVCNGAVVGVKGDTGAKGTTFTPSVSTNGNLSWVNDGGLENPDTVNLTGPKGDTGAAGADGKSPYEVAVEEGFTGTKQTFNWSLANIASHADAHEEGGTDQITVTEAMIGSGAVTTAKLGAGAVTGAKLTVDSELTEKLIPALYSPVKSITGASYSIAAADAGKTLCINAAATAVTITLGGTASTAMPAGTEIAIAFIAGASAAVTFASAVRVLWAEREALTGGVSVTLPAAGAMCAIKKIAADSTNGDLWLLTGAFEEA